MDRKKIKKDILMWSIFLIFGILMIFVIIPSQIPVSAVLAKEYITPRTFPTAICIMLSVLSVIGLINSGLQYSKLEKTAEEEPKAHRTKDEIYDSVFPFIIFALVLVYALMFKYLGFIWASVIVPPVILYLLNCRKWYMYLALYIFAAVVYVVFTFVLHVPLP